MRIRCRSTFLRESVHSSNPFDPTFTNLISSCRGSQKSSSFPLSVRVTSPGGCSYFVCYGSVSGDCHCLYLFPHTNWRSTESNCISVLVKATSSGFRFVSVCLVDYSPVFPRWMFSAVELGENSCWSLLVGGCCCGWLLAIDGGRWLWLVIVSCCWL